MCFNSIFAQKKISETIIKPLQENILYRENVFLHLNKSVYFTNEAIWITAYVAEDAENKPAIYTSNLIINLIDSEGNVLEQKTIFIKNGVGSCDFLMDRDLTSGNYFVQGATNYMRNFGKENMFIEEIEIINPSQKDEIATKEYTNTYDLQVFPESGYLLEDAINTIGIKALINGKRFPFSGEIKNSNGRAVSSFTGNEFGMGKCSFNYVENEIYTATIQINNTTQKIELPKANKTGINLSLDNTNEHQVILTLQTNLKTLPLLKKSSLAILFYRNNYISEAVSLSLINDEQTTQELIFDKSKLLDGVNTVTLFKNNQPIAERKFFVDKLENKTAILINELNTQNDSTSFKIKTINSNLVPVQTQLSIAVLPKNAKNFKENQTIKTAFLLTPYVKGVIENPAYYFNNSNQQRKLDLDLLLLNQGWSTYSLEEKIKEINPTEQFKFENGFTLNGKIKYAHKGSSIGILSKSGRLEALSELDKDRTFSFENVFGYKNDSIKLTLIKNGDPLVKPTKYSFETDSVKNLNYQFITAKYTLNPITKAASTTAELKTPTTNFSNYPNVEVLKQVNLKNVNSKRNNTYYDDEMDLASKHKIIAAGFYDNHKVTEKMQDNYLNLLHYFQQLGMVDGNCPNCIIKLRRARYSFNVGGTEGSANVFVNDVRIDPSNQVSIFQMTTMEEVDEILINRSGAGGGYQGAGGIVKIYLKKGDHKFYKYGKTLYKDLLLSTGFDRANDYYKPQYNILTEEAYNWTEIDWKSNLQTNENGEVLIKIPTNNFSNEYQFIINGFSEEGLLFNTIYKTSNYGF